MTIADRLTVRRLRAGPLLRSLDAVAALAAPLPACEVSARSVLRAASRRQGSTDWGSEAFIEPLERLMDEVSQGPWTPAARQICRQVAIRAVVNRIAIERAIAADPAIEQIDVRPLFVVGLPRTGTTLLQNLLAQEPDSRALEFWELSNPAPLHPDPIVDERQRKARTARDLALARRFVPEMPQVHDIAVDSFEECWTLLANTFCVLNFDRANGATRFGDWLLEQDVTWAYQEFRRMLQVLLARRGASTLVLKCPEHLWFLEPLLQVFPNAGVVWTHRDPGASVASYCSMVTLSRRTMFGRVDPRALGAHISDRFVQGLRRATQCRDHVAPERFFDVPFEALQADPAAVVRAARERFDLPVTTEGMDAVQRWLASPRRDGPGRHRYSAARYGLRPRDPAFTPYRRRFDAPVPPPARRVLLVHPEFPVTYWGFQVALPLSGRRANLPPLGLATLAALLPPSWELRLLDLNIEPLTAAQLAWADTVLVGGMRVQAPSMKQALARARAAGCRTVAGGPAPTSDPALFAEAHVVFQGEAEGRIGELLAAVESDDDGIVLPQAKAWPSPSTFARPRFDLLDVPAYGAMSVQYSRGCPYRCEFCDIVQLFGRRPRVKTAAQLLDELGALAETGYRGTVFVVDDNFIGNRPQVKLLLPQLVRWQAERGFPFDLMTEASVNLAEDEELLSGMVAAGFTSVFVGLETPSLEALEGAGKTQNLKLPLGEVVRRITAAGLEVMGGFIVGFDSDGPECFEAQRRFIDGSPIPMAMIGPLMALPGTDLWHRLEREGRLRVDGSGNEGDQFGRPNFEPAMDEGTLLRGYGDLMASLYTADSYYDRCEAVLALAPPSPGLRKPHARDTLHFLRTAWTVGVRSPRRVRFWRLLIRALRRRPEAFSWAVVRAMIGEHLIRYTQEHVLPRIAAAEAEVGRERLAARTDVPPRVAV